MTPAIISEDPDSQLETGQASFELLYNQYAPSIYGLIFNAMHGDDVKAQAVTVQVFKTIFHKRQHYNPNKYRIFTWMYIIVKTELSASGIELAHSYGFSKTTKPSF
ncbi:MAG: hypothetical protein ABIQ88_03855 [Chitinophagaceae bacterium]